MRLKGNKSENQNLLILKVSNETYSDETWIHFNKNAAMGYEGQFDAHKMISTSNPELPQIYSITPAGELLSINGLPETETVELGFTSLLPGTFTIEATKLMESANIILEDLKTNVFTDLVKASYTFEYIPGENHARFIVHFSPLGLTKNGLGNVSVYSSGKDVYVSVPENMKGDISVYNVTGQKVAYLPISGKNNILSILYDGVYIVKVVSNNKTTLEFSKFNSVPDMQKMRELVKKLNSKNLKVIKLICENGIVLEKRNISYEKVGKILNKSVTERKYGSLALAVLAVNQGAAIIRTHDVAATVDAIKITHAVMQ